VTLADLAPLLVGCLDGAGPLGDELLRLADSGQPKTVEVGKVVTRAARTLALYEGVSSEILQAASRRSQRLATTLIPCPCVLKRRSAAEYTLRNKTACLFHTHNKYYYHTHQEERVPGPQTPPASWAWGHYVILAVKSHCGRNCLTHHTAADVGANLRAGEGHHGYGGGGGEPIGFVVATRVVTGGFVAVGERHGGENW